MSGICSKHQDQDPTCTLCMADAKTLSDADCATIWREMYCLDRRQGLNAVSYDQIRAILQPYYASLAARLKSAEAVIRETPTMSMMQELADLKAKLKACEGECVHRGQQLAAAAQELPLTAGPIDARIRIYRAALCEQLEAREAQVAQLTAEKADLVLRNKLLRDRPDLPIERLAAYDAIMEQLAECEAMRTHLAATVLDREQIAERFARERDRLRTGLEVLKEEIEAAIDGGLECRGRDSQLTEWIRMIDEARTKRGS